MFKLNNLKFDNDQEKEEIKKFLNLKGEYLHKQIYDILFEWNDSVEVKYSELSSVIKYDKGLRDTLYKYLSLLEENLRADLCRKYDIDDKYINEKFKLWKDHLIEKSNTEKSNLYFRLDIEFGHLIELIEKVNLYDNSRIAKIKKAKDLRNKVMHHNLLMLGMSKNKTESLARIKLINDWIEILYDLLPIDYKRGFESSINGLNYDQEGNAKYLKKLCLGVMKNGICAKK